MQSSLGVAGMGCAPHSHGHTRCIPSLSRALGSQATAVLYQHVLRNCFFPITTRILGEPCILPGDLIKTQDGEGKDGAGKAELQEVSQLAMKTQKVIVTFFSTKMS